MRRSERNRPPRQQFPLDPPRERYVGRAVERRSAGPKVGDVALLVDDRHHGTRQASDRHRFALADHPDAVGDLAVAGAAPPGVDDEVDLGIGPQIGSDTGTRIGTGPPGTDRREVESPFAQVRVDQKPDEHVLAWPRPSEKRPETETPVPVADRVQLPPVQEVRGLDPRKGDSVRAPPVALRIVERAAVGARVEKPLAAVPADVDDVVVEVSVHTISFFPPD